MPQEKIEYASSMASRKSRLGGGIALVTGAMAALVALPVQAQSDEAALDEVVVTARKREERLQDVPLTVTALGAATIEKSGVDSLFDINALAPGLNYQNAQNRVGSGRLQMRGLTSGTAGGAKASAFLDGVWISGNISDTPFETLERIEVLPGPQSALFGRSTFAGAINFVTKDPGEEFAGRASAEWATEGERQLNASISGPLVRDRLGGTLNLYYNEFEGPEEWKTFEGIQQGNTRTQGVSGKLVFKPTDNLRIEARAAYTENRDGQGIVYVVDPAARNGSIPRAADAPAANQALGPARYPFGLIRSITSGVSAGSANFDGNANSANGARFPEPGLSSTSTRLALEAEWTFLDGYALTMTVADNRERIDLQQDLDSTSFRNLRNRNILTPRDTSIDLHISTPNDRKLRGMLGYYYLDFSQKNVGTTYLDNTCLTICTLASPGLALANNIANPADATSIINDSAPFGRIDWDVTDSFTATFEGRYQTERVVADNRLGTGVGRYLAKKYTAFLPRVNLDYKFNPDMHVYAVYSIGNNPGAFNTDARIGTAAAPGTTSSDFFVKEEKLKNYELGLKSEWLDGRLLFNAAVYHMKWENQIVPFTVTASNGAIFSINRNAGSSTINGLSLESNYRVSDHLDLRATLSYNDSEYDTFCSTNLGRLQGYAQGVCISVAGKAFESTPKITGTLTGTYSGTYDNGLGWSMRGGYEYQDGQLDSEMNLAHSEASNVFNLTYGLSRDRWSVDVYCRNCTDDEAPTRISRFGDGRAGATNLVNQNVAMVPRRPRQFGVKMVLRF